MNYIELGLTCLICTWVLMMAISEYKGLNKKRSKRKWIKN